MENAAVSGACAAVSQELLNVKVKIGSVFDSVFKMAAIFKSFL